MKNYLLFIIVILTAISCNDSNSEQDIYHYTYYKNSALTVVQNEATYINFANIENGNNLVFEYEYIRDDEENIADDEYSETIRFEIDSTLETFSYSNDELVTIKATFTPYCFCFFPMDPAKNVAPIGTISGVKISNTTWEIDMDVTFYGDVEKVISGKFRLD